MTKSNQAMEEVCSLGMSWSFITALHSTMAYHRRLVSDETYRGIEQRSFLITEGTIWFFSNPRGDLKWTFFVVDSTLNFYQRARWLKNWTENVIRTARLRIEKVPRAFCMNFGLSVWSTKAYAALLNYGERRYECITLQIEYLWSFSSPFQLFTRGFGAEC